MALPTNAQKLDCMREALEAAQKALEAAGIAPPAGPVADLDASDPPQRPNRPAPMAQANAPDGNIASLGAEQVAARNGQFKEQGAEQDRLHANIVAFRERLPGQMRFAFDNGQVWQQTEADAQRIRLRSGEPIAVELWSSWSGGYRMQLEGSNQIVRVERVR